MLSKLRFILNSHPLNLHLQRGQSTGYVILFIMVIIFAVMLAGGGGSLFSGNEASPDYSDDIEPSPTASPSALLDWKLSVNLKGCQTNPPGMAIEILPEGGKDGYIVAVIEITTGTFLATSFQSFAPPKQAYTYVLPSSRGYNTKNWKIELYEGGTKNGNAFSGGTLRGSYSNKGTGCN